MSYIVTDTDGMGTDVGGIVSAAGSAASSVVGGAIDLANNIGLWRQQRRDVATQREDAWGLEIDAINHDRLIAAQNEEELAARNTVIEEQNRVLDEQERVMGRERAALENQIRRSRLEAEQRQRAAIAGQFSMPTWGWFAIAGVGVLAIAGVGAYMGLKSEEN